MLTCSQARNCTPTRARSRPATCFSPTPWMARTTVRSSTARSNVAPPPCWFSPKASAAQSIRRTTLAVPALNELAGSIASGWYNDPSDSMLTRRRDRHERQDLVQPVDLGGADGARHALRDHRHARHRHAGQARAYRFHYARRAAIAAQSCAIARCGRAGGGDGSVVARAASGARERHGVRHRRIHESHARPSRLSRHVRSLRSRQGASVRVAGTARGRDQSRRCRRPPLAREHARPCAHDRLWARRHTARRAASRRVAARVERARDRHGHGVPSEHVRLGRCRSRSANARRVQREQSARRARRIARRRRAVRRRRSPNSRSSNR